MIYLQHKHPKQKYTRLYNNYYNPDVAYAPFKIEKRSRHLGAKSPSPPRIRQNPSTTNRLQSKISNFPVKNKHTLLTLRRRARAHTWAAAREIIPPSNLKTRLSFRKSVYPLYPITRSHCNHVVKKHKLYQSYLWWERAWSVWCRRWAACSTSRSWRDRTRTSWLTAVWRRCTRALQQLSTLLALDVTPAAVFFGESSLPALWSSRIERGQLYTWSSSSSSREREKCENNPRGGL